MTVKQKGLRGEAPNKLAKTSTAIYREWRSVAYACY